MELMKVEYPEDSGNFFVLGKPNPYSFEIKSNSIVEVELRHNQQALRAYAELEVPMCTDRAFELGQEYGQGHISFPISTFIIMIFTNEQMYKGILDSG